MKKLKQKIVATTILLVLVFIGLVIREVNTIQTITTGVIEIGDFTVVGGKSELDFSYNENTLTILTNKTLIISGNTTIDKIKISEGVIANIVLDGVSIEVNEDIEYVSPIVIMEGAMVNITLGNGSENKIISYGNNASLNVKEGSKLFINGTGKLTAICMKKYEGAHCYGAGIGSSKGQKSGDIEIGNGVIIAINEGDGAGIGSGKQGDATVSITGGKITAINKGDGAGIGSGKQGDATINIKGGRINVINQYDGEGIGSGEEGAAIVTMEGGRINAISEQYVMGIDDKYSQAISVDSLLESKEGMNTNIIQINSFTKIDKVEIRDRYGKAFSEPILFMMSNIEVYSLNEYHSIAFSLPDIDAEYTVYIDGQESDFGVINMSENEGIKNLYIIEPYITDENIKKFNAIDNFNGMWKETTFDNSGFTTVLKLDEHIGIVQTKSVSSGGYDVPSANINVGINISFCNDGRAVIITYILKNIGYERSTYSLVSGGNIQIGADCFAPIVSFEANSGVKVISGEDIDKNYSSEYTQLNVLLKEQSTGITDVGSILSWYWEDEIIEPGGIKTYSIKMSVGGYADGSLNKE